MYSNMAQMTKAVGKQDSTKVPSPKRTKKSTVQSGKKVKGSC